MTRTPAMPTAATAAWLGLVALTFFSLFLGEYWHSAPWLPLLVAAVVWLKGALVARYFIEAPFAHPFIAWVVRAFIAFAPVALVLTSFFGPTLARWASL